LNKLIIAAIVLTLLIIGLIILRQYNLVGIRQFTPFNPPVNIEKYGFLSDNKTENDSYAIKKIVDGQLNGDILFNTLTKEFVFKTYGKDKNGSIYWKVSQEGEVIDSLKSKELLQDIGVTFEKEYYIDWLQSGSKKKNTYRQKYNFSSIDKIELETLYQKAEEISFGSDFKEHELRCYLKIENEWSLLFSKEGFKNHLGNPANYFKVKAKSKTLILVLKNEIENFYKWEDSNNFLTIEKFDAITKIKSSNFDINGVGRAGWHGIAYFRIYCNSSLVHFKTYAFKHRSFGYDPEIKYYKFPNIYGERNLEDKISFIVLTKNEKSNREEKEVGIYVINKK